MSEDLCEVGPVAVANQVSRGDQVTSVIVPTVAVVDALSLAPIGK